MSRIGKNPVAVPSGVDLKIEGQKVTAKGKLGELSFTASDEIELSKDGDLVTVTPRNDNIMARKLWGTSRSMIQNLVIGVSEGYEKKLEINGVGYRAKIQGKDLILEVGFSHDVIYPIPEGIEIKCADQTHISVFGANKQRVGQVAAEIRGYKKPEPYKGKGIKYEGEHILRKEGKKK